MFATLYTDFRSFTVQELKRHGMLRSGYLHKLAWFLDGKKTSSIGIITNLTAADPHLILTYTMSDGESIYDRVNMLFVKSNLGINGYWHFICPFANKPCRKLYLHNRHFKSRAALPADVRYKSQTTTPSGRVMAQYFTAVDKVEEMKAVFNKPYAKQRYRGKLTRRAMQKERWSERQLLNTYRFLKDL
ncbi:MAG: hypothetical protein R3D58_17065 [Saprospiraceae bacterium]